jgi:hypothetical protein
VSITFSVTEEQSKFLKSLPNRSEFIQKFIQEQMMTQGLTEEKKLDVKIANEITDRLIQNFSEDYDGEDQEEIYVWNMKSKLIDITNFKDGSLNRFALDAYGLDNLSEEANKFLQRVLSSVEKQPADLEIIRIIFNEVRKRLVQKYQKRWAKYPPHGWDTGYDLPMGQGHVDIIPP